MIKFALFLFFFSSMAVAGTESFYDLQATTLRRQKIDFSKFKGKAILFINTASKCGYTEQFSGLQELYKNYQAKGLDVVGIPSNDFNQEALEGDKIESFCTINYGVKFTIMEKVHVKGKDINPVIKYLVAHSKQPDQEVHWNFEKFLVDRKGIVIGRYLSAVEPTDKDLLAAIEKSLAERP
jgi:glutathione peroxidase